jgi:hypothetical protein
MKHKKLDMRGFSHDIALVAFVVIFAISGVAYLVASRAASCTPVKPGPGPVLRSEGAVSSTADTSCQPASGPTSSPVSTPAASGEQLSIPPQRRPAQYVHVCVNKKATVTYVTQGTPNCLPGDTFQFNYGPNVAGTVYNVPCKTTKTNSLRYAYISAGKACPTGTTRVATTTVSGERLSQPPQRRPAQYVHVCGIGKTVYVTQGTPNCLAGGVFQFNYAPSVPGTYYNVPCATTNGNSSSSSPLRYAYISSGEVCPRGTVSVSKN